MHNLSTPPATARPLTLHAWEVRGLLAGRISTIRRPVLFNRAETGLARHMLTDPSRAWADRGFSDPDGEYRYGYLHVPYVHPEDGWAANPDDDGMQRVCCEDEPGDRVWARETWAGGAGSDMEPKTFYRASDDPGTTHWVNEGVCTEARGPWKSPACMPRWASRLTLEVLSVHPQRADRITDADGLAAGARRFDDIPLYQWHRPDTGDRWSMDDPETTGNCMGSPRLALGHWWNRTYGDKSGNWDRGWVWVRTVKVVHPEATP